MEHATGRLVGLVCVLMCALISISSVQSQRPDVAAFEAALKTEMQKIIDNKKKGIISDDESKSELSAAMDRVKHLKPDNLPPQDLIGIMGRVMKEKMGLNIGIQTEQPDGTMGSMDGQKPTKKKKKSDKGKEGKKKGKKKGDKTVKKGDKGDKKRKGPSLSKTGEL